MVVPVRKVESARCHAGVIRCSGRFVRVAAAACIVVGSFLPFPSLAQDGAQKSAVTLRAGTIIRLRTTQLIDSKHMKTGDVVSLEVMRDILVGDLLVIAKHTPVTATLTEVHRAGRGLRRGSLTLGISTIADIAGDAISITADRKQKPSTERQVEGYADAAVSFGLLAPVLPFVRGEEAILPKGLEIDASVVNDVPIDAYLLKPRVLEIETQRRVAAEQKRTGLALVHLYFRYPMLPHLPAEDHVVLIDGHKLVRLRPETFYGVEIVPGPHTLVCNGHATSLDAKADEEYYFGVIRNPAGHGWVLQSADPETAEDQMYTLSAVQSKDIYKSSIP